MGALGRAPLYLGYELLLTQYNLQVRLVDMTVESTRIHHGSEQWRSEHHLGAFYSRNDVFVCITIITT